MEQQKLDNLKDAMTAALYMSLQFPKDAVYVIQSKGEYFVETGSGFIRAWETLHAVYENGKLTGGELKK